MKDIKDILTKYLKNELTKQQLKDKILSSDLKQEFNNFIYSLLKCTRKKEKYVSKSLITNMLLDKAFLDDIKESLQVTCNYKLSKDELCKKLKMEPRLNAFFILKRNEQVNMRMRRVCIEYGIDVNKDVVKVVNEGFMHLVRQTKDFRKVFPVLNCEKNISSYTSKEKK